MTANLRSAAKAAAGPLSARQVVTAVGVGVTAADSLAGVYFGDRHNYFGMAAAMGCFLPFMSGMNLLKSRSPRAIGRALAEVTVAALAFGPPGWIIFGWGRAHVTAGIDTLCVLYWAALGAAWWGIVRLRTRRTRRAWREQVRRYRQQAGARAGLLPVRVTYTVSIATSPPATP